MSANPKNNLRILSGKIPQFYGMIVHWFSTKASLKYPAPPAPATAVLLPWFRPAGRVRVFPEGWGAGARAFQPAAIAGEWRQLEALLSERIPSLTHAVIVLARQPGELLSECQRERLWRAFQVPLFEQIVTEKGSALAMECDAHDGLHVESPALWINSRTTDSQGAATSPKFLLRLTPRPGACRLLGEQWLDSSPCGCGRKTPRLKLRDSAISPAGRAPDSARAIAPAGGGSARRA
jgi:hypothetical protein